VAVGALVGLVVFVMMIVGGAVTLFIMDTNSDSVSDVVVGGSSVDSLSVEQQRKLNGHLTRGESFFTDGKYMRAAAQFYAGLKVVPEHPTAERMGIISCEYLLLDTLQDALSLRALPQAEQQRRATGALKLGRRALRGRADKQAAVAALREVLVFLPADGAVNDMLQKLTGE